MVRIVIQKQPRILYNRQVFHIVRQQSRIIVYINIVRQQSVVAVQQTVIVNEKPSRFRYVHH